MSYTDLKVKIGEMDMLDNRVTNVNSFVFDKLERGVVELVEEGYDFDFDNLLEDYSCPSKWKVTCDGKEYTFWIDSHLVVDIVNGMYEIVGREEDEEEGDEN